MINTTDIRRRANALQPGDNARSRAVYASKPELKIAATRAALLDWCQWCDPNGSYLDQFYGSDPFDPPLTYTEALDAVASLLDNR